MWLAGVFANCSGRQSPVHYDPRAARSSIVAALPTGWRVLSSEEEQRFTTEWFSHPRTGSFILLGLQPCSHIPAFTEGLLSALFFSGFNQRGEGTCGRPGYKRS